MLKPPNVFQSYPNLYENIVHKVLVLFPVCVVWKCQWNTKAAVTIAMHSQLNFHLQKILSKRAGPEPETVWCEV